MNDVKPLVEVVFQEESATYSVGEDITGSVKISSSRLMKTQMIKIQFQAICEHNRKKRGFLNKKQKKKWEQHFNIKDILLTPRSEFNDLFLRPGTHNFPFIFQLPVSLPATFTANDGKFEYFARVVVHYRDEGSMEVNEICKEVPFVIKKVIEGFPDDLLRGSEIKQMLTLPKLLSSSTMIDVSSMVPKRVYHRGEMIRLHCDYAVKNGASAKVTGVYAVLMQNVSVKENGIAERSRSTELARAPPFHGSEGSSKWSDIYIKIPLNVSLTVQGCGSITIAHYIEIGTPKSKENLIIPIVIIDSNQEQVDLGRPRRFSLTGTSSLAPNVFRSFNTFNRNDTARLSTTSIDSHRLYYERD